MPRSRKRTPAPRGSRPARGSRRSHRGGGRLMNDTSVSFSQSGRPSSDISDVSLRYTETWIGSPTNGNGQPNSFTLAQEARQTCQQDHSSWNPDSKLRDNPVAFLSAGASEPLNPKTCDDVPSNDTTGHQCNQPPVPRRGDGSDRGIEATDVPAPGELGEAAQDTSNDHPASQAGEAASFFFDLTGQNPGKRAREILVDIPSRVSSPQSSSGEEVILFRGRNRCTQIGSTAQAVHIRAQAPTLHVDGKTPVNSQVLDIRPLPRAAVPTAACSTRSRGRRNRRGLGGGYEHGNASDDSILNDYIANMRENGEMDEIERQRPRNDSSIGQSLKVKDPDASASDEATGNIDMQGLDEAHSRESGAESELNDETLAKLFAGQSLDAALGIGCNDQYQSDNASTDEFRGHGLGPAQTRDDFDFMNWEHPSLLQRKKGKKSRGRLPLDGFDSDLEQELHAAWQNDRLKKKQRKMQREEMRVLGLLGQGTKPDDLRVKYPAGMSTTDVAQELRTFLVSMCETLTFPPMDVHARKMIHELANQFKVNSKSTGKADQRRTTIVRTKRTKPFVESAFESAMGRIRRRQLPRPDVKRKRAPTKDAAVGSGHAATSYRDGEVVGAGAAELGVENRGRAMLEKMGWSRGTALGATHNKGILQPVTHTMKRSKAGLG